MIEKILLVDDESAVLEAYQRLLRHDFQLETAVGGVKAVTAVESKGPYAVIVSDMRMPGMDGIQLLVKIKELAPDTVRIMLTGNTDVETAVHAVNEGNIFRFLTKPCTKETLGKTLTAGLLQHRLVNAERELLEKTLRGTIDILTQVLSLVNPAAFGRALRARRYMARIVQKMALKNPWQLEVAAMMSQLGCVTMDSQTLDAVYDGRTLSPDEQKLYDAHPLVGRELLANIPRLEPIAWMIARQNGTQSAEGDAADLGTPDIRQGVEILQVTLAFDEFLRKGLSKTEAAHSLMQRYRRLDPRVFQALVEVEQQMEEIKVRPCSIEKLTVGMVLNEDMRTKDGQLLATRGQEVTVPLQLKLKNFHLKGAIASKISVGLPVEAAVAAKA